MFNSDKCECNASCYHECMCDWVVKKEWQGLSDDEIVTKWIEHFVGNTFKGIEFARAVEDKLKEKNHE